MAFASGVQAGLGLGGAFNKGRERREERDIYGQIDKSQPLKQQDAFQRLVEINPTKAKNLMTALGTDEQGLDAAFKDAAMTKHLLNIDQTGARAGEFLQQRIQSGKQQGRKMVDTEGLLNTLLSKGPQAANFEVDSFLSIPSLMKQGEAVKYAPSDAEKKEKRLNSLLSELSVAESSGDKSVVMAAQQRVETFKKLAGLTEESTQTKADIAIDKANKIKLAELASKASADAFDGLKVVRSTMLNMGDAIKAIDKGADTGPIISKLPSFREAAVELDNIKGRMGLDVVGATTFGALSESELAFALDTALPTNLEPKELREWLVRKQRAQRALAKGLRDAAVFLGTPGNTIADYIEKQELKTKDMQSQSGLTPEEEAELAQLEAEFGEQ